jgi:adenosine deaminase
MLLVLEMQNKRQNGLRCDPLSASPSFELHQPLIFKGQLVAPEALTSSSEDFQQYDDYINSLVNNVRAIRQSTRDVLKTFEADNVRYLELRITPREIYVHEDSGLSCLSKEKYVETVLVAIDDHETIKGHKMRVKLMLSIDRDESVQEANRTLELALQFQERGVVGVDLCGNPLASNDMSYESTLVEARASTLNMTLHFADTQAFSEDAELKRLLNLHPDRLGHVLYVEPRFKEAIVKHGIGLELCLSSDVHSQLNGDYDDHPFSGWRKVYEKIALCVHVFRHRIRFSALG